LNLLEQLRLELPEHAHRRRVYYTADRAEVDYLVASARKLEIKTIRYLLTLEKFEVQPPLNDPRREAYDDLIAVLHEVSPHLVQSSAIEKSDERD
jgi:hypothetical protein